MHSQNSKTATNYRHRGGIYPTLGFVLAANRRVLRVSGDAQSVVLNQGSLESAVNAPVESAGNQEAYPYLFDKVAALTYRLVSGHVFADGNKRTGLAVAETVLHWNKHNISANDETVTLVMLLLASGHLDVDGLRTSLLYMCGVDPSTVT